MRAEHFFSRPREAIWTGAGPLAAVGRANALLATRRLLALVAFALAEALAPLLSSLLNVLIDRPRPRGGLFTAAGRRPWWIAAGLGRWRPA